VGGAGTGVVIIEQDKVKYTHLCGWYRVATHLTRWYDHPIYGRVSNSQAARLDTLHHNCVTYREAVTRIQRVVKEWNDAHGIDRDSNYYRLRRAVD
jgi:hypothetical protein